MYLSDAKHSGAACVCEPNDVVPRRQDDQRGRERGGRCAPRLALDRADAGEAKRQGRDREPDSERAERKTEPRHEG